MAAEQFTEIKITALDESASGPSGQGPLVRLVLKLSQSVPSLWSEYFNRAWQEHVYMKKRRVTVFGDRLEIICLPNELEQDHLPELNKVISETNRAYKSHQAEPIRIGQAKAEAARQQQKLSELTGKSKFD